MSKTLRAHDVVINRPPRDGQMAFVRSLAQRHFGRIAASTKGQLSGNSPGSWTGRPDALPGQAEGRLQLVQWNRDVDHIVRGGEVELSIKTGCRRSRFTNER